MLEVDGADIDDDYSASTPAGNVVVAIGNHSLSPNPVPEELPARGVGLLEAEDKSIASRWRCWRGPVVTIGATKFRRVGVDSR